MHVPLSIMFPNILLRGEITAQIKRPAICRNTSCVSELLCFEFHHHKLWLILFSFLVHSISLLWLLVSLFKFYIWVVAWYFKGLLWTLVCMPVLFWATFVIYVFGQCDQAFGLDVINTQVIWAQMDQNITWYIYWVILSDVRDDLCTFCNVG